MGKGSGRKPVLFSEVVTAIGHGCRGKMQKNTSLAAKTGAFLLWEFEKEGMIKVALSQGATKHAAYVIEVVNDEDICKLFETVPVERIEKLPSLSPYEDWVSSMHENGTRIVKTNCAAVLKELTVETQPIIFEAVNRAQRTGWTVDDTVYALQQWAFRNKTDAFSGIWEVQNAEAKASKIRETKAIFSVAKRFLGHTFYNMHTLDFRGRLYVSTAYLNNQGTDTAKGLLRRADKKAIGRQGFCWLLISIATNWGGDAKREDGYKTDKLPLNDRVAWALDNEEVFMSYVENPKVNVGWMYADCPWQFISACIELKKFRDWQYNVETHSLITGEEFDEYGYESHLECFVDG
jgi:DNA-directed RNA polymerase